MQNALTFETEPFEIDSEGASARGETGSEIFEVESTGPVQQTSMPIGPFGTLTVRGRSEYRYSFTPEDALWLARFVIGEAGGRDDSGSRAVIWAMFNRYALFTRRAYSTFSRFLRAYSTPLQAMLNSGGAAARHYQSADFVRTGGNYTGRYAHVPRGQVGRFLRLQATPWNSLPPSARGLSERALRGQIPNPIGNASEFANTAVYYRQQHGQLPTEDQWRAYNEGLGQQKRWTWIGNVQGLAQFRHNTFFVDNRIAQLPQGAVIVTGPGQGHPSALSGVTPPPTIQSQAGPYPRVTVQLKGGLGLHGYGRASRRFGHPLTILALITIGMNWFGSHPRGPRIGIGDISKAGGGPLPPHKSHQKGLDVDIRLPRNDGAETGTTYKQTSYSRQLTQELVNIIHNNGVLPVEFIFFNDPQVTGVRPWPGHDNHLHVRFRLPSNSQSEVGFSSDEVFDGSLGDSEWSF